MPITKEIYDKQKEKLRMSMLTAATRSVETGANILDKNLAEEVFQILSEIGIAYIPIHLNNASEPAILITKSEWENNQVVDVAFLHRKGVPRKLRGKQEEFNITTNVWTDKGKQD